MTVEEYIKGKKLKVSEKEIDQYLVDNHWTTFNKTPASKADRSSISKIILMRKISIALNADIVARDIQKPKVKLSGAEKVCDWLFQRYFEKRVLAYIERVFEPILAKQKLENLEDVWAGNEKFPPFQDVYKKLIITKETIDNDKLPVASKIGMLKAMIADAKRRKIPMSNPETEAILEGLKKLQEKLPKKSTKTKKTKTNAKRKTVK